MLQGRKNKSHNNQINVIDVIVQVNFKNYFLPS